MNGVIEKYHQRWNDQRQNVAVANYKSVRVLGTFERLFRHIIGSPFEGRILDVGCGDGSFVRACRDRGLAAEGIDIKDGCDLEKDPLPYDDGSFDVVVMASVIEHLHDPDNLLTQIQRVLRPEGKVICVTPEWTYTLKYFYNDPTHVRPYTHTSLKVMMEMYGFPTLFMGLWTVDKSHQLWRLPVRLQFVVGNLLAVFRPEPLGSSFFEG